MATESRNSNVTKIDSSGRVVIPAWARRQLNLNPNAELRVRVYNGMLWLEPPSAGYLRARKRLQQYLADDRSDVKKLWRERRDEAAADD